MSRERRVGRRPGVPGRPRHPADKVRAHGVRIRLSETEMAYLEVQADGRPLSTAIREELMKLQNRPTRIPRANREIAGQLARIGNNLNQLVRLAHTGRFPAHLEPVLRQLYEMLTRYQRELMGGPR